MRILEMLKRFQNNFEELDLKPKKLRIVWLALKFIVTVCEVAHLGQTKKQEFP
jgi:hypothetical protein